MPIDALNAHITFVAMMIKLQDKWNHKEKQKAHTRTISRVIVDDVILATKTKDNLLKLQTMYSTPSKLQSHHLAEKCKF